MRTVIKDGMHFEADILEKPIRYNKMRIELQKLDGKMPKALYIKVNEKIYALDEITPELLFSVGCEKSKVSEYIGLPEGSYSIFLCDKEGRELYNFIATKEKILSFYIGYKLKGCLLNAKKDREYTFPMTYEEIVELVGLPDKTVDWFTW
jgi:hypothetical protein